METFFRQRKFFLFALLLSLLLGCLISYNNGLNVCSDLRNYHLYNAWALLAGRLDVDLYPAGFHSYIPSVIHIPFYFLTAVLFPGLPRLASFLAGIPAGASIFLGFLVIYRILKSVAGFSDKNACSDFQIRGCAVLLTLFGLFHRRLAGSFSLMGNEILACLVLFSFLLLLNLKSSPALRAAAIGFSLGLAFGLKFTTALFSPPFLFAILFLLWREKTLFRSVLLFLAAWGVAFLASYGMHAWRMFQHFGNPLFPVLDGVFSDNWLGDNNIGSTESYLSKRPKTLWEIPLAPFQRSIVGLTLLPANFAFLLLLVIKILSRFRAMAAFFKRRGFFQQSLPQPAVAFLLLYSLSFLFWAPMFSVIQYLAPCLHLSGLILFLLFHTTFSGKHGFAAKFFFYSILTAGTVFNLFNYSSVLNESEFYKGNESLSAGGFPGLPENALLLAGRDCSCVFPFLYEQNPSLVFVGGMNAFETNKPLFESRMKREIAKKISEHNGEIFLLSRKNSGFVWPYVYTEPQTLFPQYGLECAGAKTDSPAFRFKNRFGEFLIFRCIRQAGVSQSQNNPRQ